jgi:hypothetical protein
VFVVGRLIERGAGDWTAAAQVLALEEGLRRHLEAQSKKGKSSSPDAESSVARCITAGEMKRQDYETCTMIAQPTAGTLGNRGLRSHTELDGHGAYIPVAQPVPYDLFQITAPVNRQNRKPGDPGHTLARDNAAHAAIAIGTDCYNGAITGDVAATMGTPGSSVNASGPTVMQAMAFPIDTQNMTEGHSSGGLGFGQSGDPSFTVTKGHSHAVAHAFYRTGGTHGVNQHPEVSPAVKVGSGLGIPSPPAVAHTLNLNCYAAKEDGTGRGSPLIPHAMTVRRLTPVECEFLQGFPRNWTAIPWRKKPAEECPDGPRYKALGNSMACNCMAWIGERIAKWEAAR